ncbi:hypothetical protein F5B22DRAFT_627737 [Xylaria bambusicola]|uniref:uncharacterized protein n=1 Tax=Xylaria bambusicola TaxID=326684 RepID=UPI002008AD9B|nr:uncharacterized protein F5B22DRAFT_627737 [Xylaria bambusicola]KAI0505427.1 hypothetical protein F5B22DRAFT_627737 [Xylaria bambusicola]
MADGVCSFSKVLKELKIRFPEEPRGLTEKGCSIRRKSSWGDVLVVLDDVATAYAAKDGLKGLFKRAKGFIEDQADTIERGSRLVPDIGYSKPIVGTLTFILTAFKQTSKVRQEVSDGVEKLKKKFDLVEDYIELYSTKPKVTESAMTLYVTILQAIEEVIGYYTRHMVIKGFKALWNGENYEESLLSCLEDITSVSKELMDEADTAHKQMTNAMAKDVQTGFQDVKILVEQTEKDLKESLKAMFKDHIAAMEARHAKEKQLLRHEIEQRDAERARFEQLYYRSLTPAPPSKAECIVKQEDFLVFLDMTGIETTDIEYITQQRELVISRGRDRTEQVMKSNQLREWLIQPHSKELLIHGNGEPLPISPLSFFCATIMQNLRGVGRFKSVAFFCGCHPYDDYGGGRTLIMSLLSQLLQQQQFDLSFIDHETAHRMSSGDSLAFCYVFGRLLEQVNTNETVFCVIDGINFYECAGEEPLQEMSDVLRFLLDLSQQRDSVYKILVTSPSSTEDVRQAIKDEDYLALPDQATNTIGFSKKRSERQWQEAVDVS